MLFTEQNLNYGNAMSILDNAAYLNESESMIHPQTIPVKEVSRLGYGVVRFDDVDSLAEAYGCDYIDAMYAIAESSNMNPEYLAVAVPEEDIIAYPEIVNELANIVVQPLSEYDFGYRYVDMCLEAWDNTGNESYLDAIIDDSCLEEAAVLLEEEEGDKPQGDQDPTLWQKIKGAPKALWNAEKDYGSSLKTAWGAGNKTEADKAEGDADGKRGFFTRQKDRLAAIGSAMWANKKMTAANAAVAGAGAYGVYRFAKYVKEARNRPKSWIGKKIAALRSIYQKWMQQAQKNPKKAGIIKSACAKLLSIIDALMAQLQRAAG